MHITAVNFHAGYLPTYWLKLRLLAMPLLASPLSQHWPVALGGLSQVTVGLVATFFAAACIVASDVGAYFVGTPCCQPFSLAPAHCNCLPCDPCATERSRHERHGRKSMSTHTSWPLSMCIIPHPFEFACMRLMKASRRRLWSFFRLPQQLQFLWQFSSGAPRSLHCHSLHCTATVSTALPQFPQHCHSLQRETPGAAEHISEACHPRPIRLCDHEGNRFQPRAPTMHCQAKDATAGPSPRSVACSTSWSRHHCVVTCDPLAQPRSTVALAAPM